METKKETINDDEVVIEKVNKLLGEVSKLLDRKTSTFIYGLSVNSKGYAGYIGEGIDILKLYIECINNLEPEITNVKKAIYLILKEEYENTKV